MSVFEEFTEELAQKKANYSESNTAIQVPNYFIIS